jgi:N-carbamoyl-L-amino-acid hydrolase
VTFEQMWRELAPLGRDSVTGGYRRSPFAAAARECVAWYGEQARRRELDIRWDGQGNGIAWWRPQSVNQSVNQSVRASAKGILVGSHLDSVDNGGAFDGPLGVVSSFAAIDQLRDHGFVPSRPIGVALFVEEEGSRFGIACLGSRLATGRIAPDDAARLRDGNGVFLLDAMASSGIEPKLGPSDLLRDVELFVELHVEQGRDLVHRGVAVGVGSTSWAHGRWRFDFTGQPNHAGATAMDDRRDPMLTYAMTALAANKQARSAELRATFGRVVVEPNVTNAIPERVRAWLDARGPDASEVEAMVSAVARQAQERALRDGTSVDIVAESVSPTVEFDVPLSVRIAAILNGAPLLPTGAGHDAAILQLAGIPSAMLYVRNPSGISHAPEEHADIEDCLAGVDALTKVLAELAA